VHTLLASNVRNLCDARVELIIKCIIYKQHSMTHAFSKIAKATLGFVVAATMVVSAAPAFALTASDISMLQAAGIINASQAAALMATIGSSATTNTGTCYQFTTTLTVGTTSEAVRQLQIVLNSNPATALSVPAGSNGSVGHETTYFGSLTGGAVIRFQRAHGITAVVPQVGPQTRGLLNALCAVTGPVTTTPPPTTTGPVSAMLSLDNPASGTVIAGQATADLMHVTFTGTGTVTSATFQRTGLSLNTDLTNVYLYQGATPITDSASVNSNGVITFTGMNLAVNGSVTLAVRADIYNLAAGSDVGVTLTSFTANGTAVATNVMGNRMSITVSSGLLGTAVVTMAASSPLSVNAGSLNYTLWTAPVQISTHAMSLKGATFHFVGSAPTNSIANLGLYVDGIKVASSTGVNSFNYVVFDLMGTPKALTTGSHTFDVRGDIVNGASRTAQLSLQNAGDLMISDNTVGVNVSPTATGSQTSFPLNGNTISISTGSLSISVDPTFTATTNITGGATNTVIARYKINAYGEDEKITSITLTPTIAGGTPATTGLNNVQLYLNGSQIGSVCQYTGPACIFTLGSSAIVPGGATPSMLEVRADLQNAAGTNYTAGTISVAGTLAAQGVYSYNTLTAQTVPATTAVTISAGQMVVAKNGAYTNQTLSPNTAATKIGSFTIQNQSSSEAVRVTNLAVALTADGVTALTSTQFSNFTNVKTSETTGSGATPQNGAANLNFSVDFTIAAGATKTVDIYADIGSATQGVETTLLVTAYGASSNVTLTGSAVTGQLVSVATGTVSAPVFIASTSTTPQYIATATSATDASKETFQFTSMNGAGTVNNLKFAVINSSSTSNTVASIRVGSQVASVVTPSAVTAAGASLATAGTTVAVSATANIPVGTILKVDTEYMLVTAVPSSTTFTVTRGVIGSTATGHATAATVTPSGLAYLTNVNVAVPNGTSGSYVDAFATYSPANGTTGAVASGTTSNVYLTYVKSTIGTSVSDAAVTPQPVSTTTNLMTIVGSKPTLAVNTAQQTGLVIGAENKIGEVTVTADAAGTIGVKTITFSVGNSGFSTGFLATAPRLADGSTTITTASCAATGTSLVTAPTTVETCTFSSDYLLTPGPSKTFSLYATVSGTTTSGTTVSVSTAATAAGFTWTDVAGGGVSGAETGAKIYNFPTGSYSIRQ
jgi:hypothetical protein